MVCNDKCGYFVDSTTPYCSISGLAVSEGMRCIEEDYPDDLDDGLFEDENDKED